VAAALVLVAAVFLDDGLRGHRRALAGPVGAQPAAPSTTGGTAPPGIAPPALARSAPVALRIPAIGVSVPVSLLGINADGSVQVPTDVQEPGWFQPGPSPGQVGSAVILGHVDSYLGPGVFFDLRSLQPGDALAVTLADGTVAHFAVRTVVMYPKAQFPDREVYGSYGYSALQLVTCGGTFDPQTGHYLSNVVVYSAFVGSTPPAAAVPAAVTLPAATGGTSGRPL
jgi:hypothetical protein